MEEDDDRVRGLPCGAHLLQQPWHVLCRCEPGLPRSCGPGRDELVVEHLRRADDGDPLAVDRAAEGAVGLLRVEADAHDREAVALRRGERVAKAGLSVVEPVVVRHRRHVDAAAAQSRERARGSAEHERLRRRRAAGRHGRLQVHDREISLAEDRLDRIEDASGIGRQPRFEHAFEVHVSAEREHDGLAFGIGRRARELIPARCRFTLRTQHRAGENGHRESRGDDGESKLREPRHEITIASGSRRIAKGRAWGPDPWRASSECYLGRFFCFAIAPASRSPVMNMCA